ncbi:hypothetical protein FUA25_09675 [Chryseobacterium sp.]|nr:hypothetical protein FUA25_09675 [Chryseobacterium sp.]
MQRFLRNDRCLQKSLPNFRNHCARVGIDSVTFRNGPATVRNGPATVRNGSATSGNGSATVRNGPATCRNGPATFRNGPATLPVHFYNRLFIILVDCLLYLYLNTINNVKS